MGSRGCCAYAERMAGEGVPDWSKTDLRCFWNQKRVAGRLESTKRELDGDLTCGLLSEGRLIRFDKVELVTGV